MQSQRHKPNYLYTNRPTHTLTHMQQWVIHTREGVGSQKCLRSDVTYTGALDPNLDLCVLFFFLTCSCSPSFAISLYLFCHKHAFMWLYLRPYFSLTSARHSAAPSPVRPNKVSSILFIISNNRAITQVSIWGAALYESHPALAMCVRGAAWECSFNHLWAPLLSGRERERGEGSHLTEITRSGRQRGANNDAVVSEMAEVRSFLSVVSVGLTGRGSKPDIYFNEPFQNLKDEHAGDMTLMVRLFFFFSASVLSLNRHFWYSNSKCTSTNPHHMDRYDIN